MDVKVEIRLDSSIGRHLGAGSLETQECQTLWVQKKVKILENVVAFFSRD